MHAVSLSDAVLSVLPDGVATFDASGELTYCNDAAARLCGFASAAEMLSSSADARMAALEVLAVGGQPWDPQAAPWVRALAGERADETLVHFRVRDTGEERFAMLTSAPLLSASGDIVGSANRFRDVTAEVRERRQIELDRTVVRIANAFASELDHDRLVQKITDEATAATGAQFGSFFFNSNDANGGKYLLYTLSGAPVEAFSKFGMPRATPLFGSTFRGEGVIRSADVRKDPRYGQWAPHHGMPRGHLPVVSYLAVPVIAASGEVLGGLFFGHGEPDRFTEDHERIVVSIARQAAIALENARLHQQAQQQLQMTRLALSAGRLGTWEWDIAASRVRWSPELERMHGIPEGSFDGTFEAYQSDIHPDDKERVLGSVREVLETKRPHYLLYRIVRPDGEVRWLEANGRLECAADGSPIRLVGVCSDVTERVAAEETTRSLAIERAARDEAEQAHRRLSEVLEAIADPFSIIGDDLTIQFANPASVASLHMTPEQVVGKNVVELVPDVAQTGFHAAIERVVRERVPAKVIDYYAPFEKWFEASYYPLKSGGFASHSRDITATKQNELLTERMARHEQLRADVSAHLARHATLPELLRAVCQAIVDTIGVAFARIWTVDTVGTTLELQASAGLYTHIDGAHARVSVGKFKIGRIAEERVAHLTNDVPSDPRVGDPGWAREQGLVAFAGYPLLVEGKLVGVLAMFSKQRLADDTFSALRLIADAIAQGIERKRAEEALVERAGDLARSNRELEQFAYVASHDLQEPLRTVSSYVQLLQRRYQGKLDEKADEFIGFAVEGATRMQRLIEDLLTFSRVGTRAIEVTEIAVSEVLADVCRDLGPLIRDAGAEVTCDALPSVYGDRGRIAQLLQNLVTNGVKFRAEAPPRIHVSASDGGHEWVFSVRDNGIGIDAQYFDRIFVIFQRLHGRTKYPGTGIGLSICKKIVDLHGGRIWVESRPGEGSTFFFTIPKSPRARVERTS